MFFVVLPLLLPIVTLLASGSCENIGKGPEKGDFPLKETEYDVRPNLFISKEHLLGTNVKEEHHKKSFAYGTGPLGPHHWPKLFPKCGGKKQSPINIDIVSLKRISLPRLKWSELYEKLPTKMAVLNNGHTVMLHAQYDGEDVPKIEGGPLCKPYLLEHIHFHWSQSDHKGSEHTINRKTYPMEMHAVHYRSDLNKTVAMSTDKGLVVVGYIFEISDKCNDAIQEILDVADVLKSERDTPVGLENFFRLDGLLDLFDREYVTYQGSLTTPPCYESVIWLISPYTLSISRKQIEKFRSIAASIRGFGDNYRPTQPLNNRLVNFVN